MSLSTDTRSRRLFLGALGAAFFTTRGLFAEQLLRTPPLTEGPFYPDKLPLDTDNDLIIVNDRITPAVGEVTHLGGRILDAKGDPIRNALVEIWQVDGKAVYLHTADSSHKSRDTNFQGYGRFLTGSSGEYYFRTIKPVPYNGRPAPHIHMKIRRGRAELLTTQVFIAGFANNARDGVYLGMRDPVDRELASADFNPVKDSKINECAARFDVVLGRTPPDRDEHHH